MLAELWFMDKLIVLWSQFLLYDLISSVFTATEIAFVLILNVKVYEADQFSLPPQTCIGYIPGVSD
jgi:hypothetical protein